MTTMSASPAHLPPTTPDMQYRIGASFVRDDTNDLWLNTTLPDGTILVAGEPEGWEGIEFITPIDTAGGRDGGLMGPQSVAPRTLNVQVAIIAGSAFLFRNYLRRLRTMLGPRKTVVWEQYDYGRQTRLALLCRGTGAYQPSAPQGWQPGGQASLVNFTLVAGTPWKMSTGQPHQQCLSLPVDNVSGRTYNKTYDYNYGDILQPGGQGVFVNAGDMDASPIYTFTGPLVTVQVSNNTTGQDFFLTGSPGAGVQVTVNAATGEVNPNNYRVLGVPWALVPGPNDVRWRQLGGIFSEDAQMCLSWRDTSE